MTNYVTAIKTAREAAKRYNAPHEVFRAYPGFNSSVYGIREKEIIPVDALSRPALITLYPPPPVFAEAAPEAQPVPFSALSVGEHFMPVAGIFEYRKLSERKAELPSGALREVRAGMLCKRTR